MKKIFTALDSFKIISEEAIP